jgi:hypothetical protein
MVFVFLFLINNYKLKTTKNKQLKWDARCNNEEGTEKQENYKMPKIEKQQNII